MRMMRYIGNTSKFDKIEVKKVIAGKTKITMDGFSQKEQQHLFDLSEIWNIQKNLLLLVKKI